MDHSEMTFDWRDEFWRKKVGERLVNAFKDDVAISPLMLAGDWGGGKTEFTLKTINLIKERLSSATPVYLDAYKTDYHDDPLIALSAAVLEAVPEKDKVAVKKRLIPVVRAVGKVSLKALSSWVLKQDATDVVDDFEKDIKKSADKASDALIDSVLQDQIDANKYLEAFKKVLKEAAKDVQLIFFIDELDRCKPTYSVQMLEIVKHVFDVENVKFVLVVNRTQLEASINHHYGSGLNAKRYLDKFIAFSITLPEKLKDYGSKGATVSSVHFNLCVTRSTALSNAFYKNNRESFLYGEIYAMCLLEGLSLRELETFIRYLEIYQSIKPNGCGFDAENGLVSTARAFGVYLYCFHQKTAHELTIGRISTSMVYEKLKKKPILPFVHRSFKDLDLLAMAIFIDDPVNSELVPTKEEDVENLQKWKNYIDKHSNSASFHFGDVEPYRAMLEAIKIMSFNAD
jgi:hypothetical protein